MVDIVDRLTRSKMMSSIRSSDTQPEIAVRRFLHRNGFRYRLDTKIGRIKPDIVLVKYMVAVFVHGCYWHRHNGCRFATTPSSNVKFWKDKFRANVNRDKRVQMLLISNGWKVVTIWGCLLKEGNLDKSLKLLPSKIRAGKFTAISFG